MDDRSHVLVTGGAGFIGSRVCEVLLRRGAQVTAIDNLSTGRHANLAGIVADSRFVFRHDDVTTAVAFAGLRDVTHVVHLACPASPTANLAMPVETLRAASLGTLHALELAAAHHARIVVASSSEVYGDPAVHPQPEDYRGNCDPVGRFAAYTEGKRFSEAAAAVYRRKDVNVGIVRPFNVYGPGMGPDDGRVVAAFCSAALRGATLTVAGGTQTRSLVYLDDFVDGLLAMLDSDVFGPVNLGNATDETTIADLARLVVQLAGRGTVTVTDARAPEVAVRRPDTTRAQHTLGWQATTGLRDGLRRTLDWMAGVLGEPVPQ